MMKLQHLILILLEQAPKNSTIEIYFESNIEGESINLEDLTYTKTLLTTTSSNEFGRWSISALAPTNNEYLLTAVTSTTNYRSTSNSVAVKANYDFDADELVIKSPINDSVTHQNKYTISGRSPNGILNIFMDDTLINQLNVIDKSWEIKCKFTRRKVICILYQHGPQ